MRFARENNIRPTVVSTGHDFNGASSQAGSTHPAFQLIRLCVLVRAVRIAYLK